MKKIMFNDNYGLTGAVLSGRKTQTRRVIPKDFFTWNWDFDGENLWWEDCNGDWRDARQSKYAFQVGEVIAIAQSYASIVDELEDPKNFYCMEHWESASPERAHYVGYLEHPGFTNKMFVSADEMPHQIRITNVRVERLQDVSDEDCLKEGIGISATANRIGYPLGIPFKYFISKDKPGSSRNTTPREAYACLIDKVSSVGTWESNPYVFVYDFELVK